MKKMVDEQKNLVDPNHNDDDSESSENSSGDENNHKEFTFVSAIDVGSHFIDVNPGNELQFQNMDGSLITQFTLSNPC
jgi:hypothetical protein